MATTEKIIEFFCKPFFKKKSTLLGLWAFIGIISAVTKLHSNNNYLIFKYVYYHTINQTSLFAAYPEYSDVNHYGPLFSMVIAPFAILPDWVGMILWCLLLALLLYWSVTYLPKSTRIFVVWFCAHELLTALFMQQYNVAIAAGILFSFYFIEKEKDFWAAFWIVLGTFVKLYGIVGIAFFFFSRHKMKLISSLIFWGAVMFALPMLISSPEYIIGQYREWFACLLGKNDGNLLSTYQNISLLGIIRKSLYALSGGISTDTCWIGGKNPAYSDAIVIALGCLAMAIGYFRIKQWKNMEFRQNVLAGVLMFVCLFSTGTESSGYIIALVGCCIWYCQVPWKRNKWDIALMVFAFVVTSLSPSDLFPKQLNAEIIRPFALKALPVAIIWIKLICELTTRNYSVSYSNEKGNVD